MLSNAACGVAACRLVWRKCLVPTGNISCSTVSKGSLLLRAPTGSTRRPGDTEGETYYDNCRAPIEFAERAIRLSGAPHYKLVKGWLENTLPEFAPPRPIAILRLDGDWYDSTMISLESLFKLLAPDGT